MYLTVLMSRLALAELEPTILWLGVRCANHSVVTIRILQAHWYVNKYVTNIVNSRISLCLLYSKSIWPSECVKCSEWPKRPSWLNVVKQLIYVLLVSATPKFHFVSMYDQPLLSYRPFWGKCAEWLQTNIGHHKVHGAKICVTFTPKSQISASKKFTPFSSTVNYCRVCGNFETTACSDLQMSLNATRWKARQICVTVCPHVSKISVSFILQPALFKMQSCQKS